MKKQPELIRGLGLIGAASVVAGSVIGTGIFLVPSSIARQVDSVGLVFAVWIVGGLLSLAGALSYAELGAALPEAGGEYVFLRRGYGPLWGYLYGWEQFVIGKTGSIATIATAFALFLGYFFGTLQEPVLNVGAWSLTGAQLISLVAIVGLTVINYLGIIVGGAVQTVFTLLKVAVILALVALGFAIGHGQWSNLIPLFALLLGAVILAVVAVGIALYLPFFRAWVVEPIRRRQWIGKPSLPSVLKGLAGVTLVALGIGLGRALWSTASISASFAAPRGASTLSAFGVGLVAALWAYDGWNNLVMVGGEVRDPQRNIPRALIFGMLGVGLVYMLVNAVYFYVLPLEAVKSSPRVAQDVARIFLGAWGGVAITVGTLISTFATLNGAILSGARVPYAMARDGLFFRHMAEVHPLHRTPAKALWLQCVLSSLLILIFGQSPDAFDRLFTFTIFGLWIFYGMTTASVIVLRRKEPNLPRPYRTLGYPWVPGVFVVVAALFCLNTLLSSPQETGLGLAFLAAGLPFYLVWRKRAAVSHLGWEQSRGIQELLPWVRGEILVMGAEAFPNTATEALKAEGAQGSSALALLIHELAACRSPKIGWALVVAERLGPSPDLVEAVQAVIAAPGLRTGTRGKFLPEIEGSGKIGWTDGTESRVKGIARRVLDSFAGTPKP